MAKLATFKAQDILARLERLGFCVEEGNDLLKAARGYDTAQQALRSAKNNTGAGKAAVGGMTVVLIGCATFETGVGGALCVGGGLLGFLSGDLWVESASDAEELAEAQFFDARKDMNDAMQKLCKCIGEHE